MNINPFYIEYFKQTVGFSPVPPSKVFTEYESKSTEQFEYQLDYSSSDSTIAKIITLLLDQIFDANDNNRISLDFDKKFSSLSYKWKEETIHLSSINDICTHPAYQQIIGMGKSVLPFIINELKTSPDHWFWALKSITGEDPVSETDRGNINRMTKAWIEWASRKGI